MTQLFIINMGATKSRLFFVAQAGIWLKKMPGGVRASL
jgi:hypothetical protein